MSNYESMAKRQRKWLLYLMVLFVIGAVITPFTTVFLGLLLGSVVGFYNLWLMQRRINLQGEAAQREGKRIGIGTISRLASAALGALVAIQYDQYFNIIGFIIGLMAVYIVIMIDFFLYDRE